MYSRARISRPPFFRFFQNLPPKDFYYHPPFYENFKFEKIKVRFFCPPPLEKTLKLNINYSWILMYLCIIKIYFITINDLVLNAPVQSEKHE